MAGLFLGRGSACNWCGDESSSPSESDPSVSSSSISISSSVSSSSLSVSSNSDIPPNVCCDALPSAWDVTITGGWFQKNLFTRGDFPTSFRCVYTPPGQCNSDPAPIVGLVHWNSETLIEDLPTSDLHFWTGVDCGRETPDVENYPVSGTSFIYRHAVTLTLLVSDNICQFTMLTASMVSGGVRHGLRASKTVDISCLDTNSANDFFPAKSNTNFTRRMGWYLNGAASWSPGT